MKKLFLLVLFLVAILLVSCNTETPSESVPSESLDDVSTHTHDFTFKVDFDENGHTLTCECGETKSGEHVEGSSKEVKKATCVSEGSKYVVCKECGYRATVSTPKAEHTHEKIAASPATCTQKGVSAYEHCDICNIDFEKETLPMLDHDYKDGVCTMCGSRDPDVSEYVVVPHTEYIPEPTDKFVPLDETGGDNWHGGYFFLSPPASFYEYFSDRIDMELHYLMRSAYKVDGMFTEFSYGFWLEYLKITKEEYIAYLDYAVDMNDPAAVEKFDRQNPFARCVSGWYSDNYYTYPAFIATDATYTPEHYYAKKTDGKHNSRYYAIHENLINYVGKSKFKEFLKKYENTTDCNIVTFVKYFDIDWVTFNKIMAGNEKTFYLSRFVYGDKELQDAFFGFYDGDTNKLNVFVPREWPSRESFYHDLSRFHDPRIFEFSDAFEKYFMRDEKGELTAQAQEFERLFGKTYLHNYSFYIDYYGITEEEWKDFLDKAVSDEEDLGNAFLSHRILGELAFDLDLLFREERFLDCAETEYATNYPYYTYYGKIVDDKYNQYYYMIDRMLIEHVGKKAFEKFLGKYEGTADCNIVKFLEFNDLSANDVKYVYRHAGGLMPYNVSVLYGDKNSADFMAHFGALTNK